MEIIQSASEFKYDQKTVVTIGTFDGVHIGHQKILSRLIESAKTQQKKSVLLTFFPHPRMVLQKDVKLELINTISEKADLLEAMGLDFLVIHPFSRDFSRMTALDFVRDLLVNQLHTSKLVIGYDHHFGKNREGNIDQLREYSNMFDYEVEEIPAQDIDEVAVSSTKIRRALHQGDIKTANTYLGYQFTLTGKVVNGKKLGGKIGYPTANIDVEASYKLIPKTGVYIIETQVNNSTCYGMMNIGYRPTVEGKHQTIEVHLFDFSGNLYGTTLKIGLLKYLREEQKFDSVEALVQQLHQDKSNALLSLKNNSKI